MGAVITAELCPLQMTSFTKSYFTRGYKGHTAFRALHRLQGRQRHSGSRFSFLPKNGHSLTVGLRLQRVIKDIVKLQLVLRAGAVTISKGTAFACVKKVIEKVLKPEQSVLYALWGQTCLNFKSYLLLPLQNRRVCWCKILKSTIVSCIKI